jgi:hypothetical protein
MKCNNPNCKCDVLIKDEGILLFIHCKKCMEDKPEYLSMNEYSYIETGWTKKGLQIRCKRHDINIINLDFEGRQIKEIPGK